MAKEIDFGTQQVIQTAIEQIIAPWSDGAGFMPTLSPLEVARVAEIPQDNTSLVIKAIFGGLITVTVGWSDQPLQALLADQDGIIETELNQRTKDNAPIKRVINASRFFSRQPGSQVIVKKKIQWQDIEAEKLRQGRDRLRIVFQPVQTEDTQEKRKLIRQKRDERAIRKLDLASLTPEQKTLIAGEILQRNNSSVGELVSSEAMAKMARSLTLNNSVEFLQFTCPVINARLLTSQEPEQYIVTDPKGNNFESTISKLLSIVRSLKNAGVDSTVNIILGDTDEAEYIFPILGQNTLNKSILDFRFKLYVHNLQNRLTTRYPGLSFNIFRWSEIKALSEIDEIPEPNFNPQDQINEIARMVEIFSLGNYYNGVLTPTPEQLVDIVRLKFMTYARQGYILARAFPNALLLQNELPPLLRTRMINAANTSDTQLSVIYPYGREDSPY